MIGHTKAFAAYRALSQAHINFVVLVCHAVPALRADMAHAGASFSHPPDHFKVNSNPKEEVANYSTGYQAELARSTVITVFSYFEAYVKDALREVIEFHGGESSFKNLAKRRTRKFLDSIEPDLKLHKRKIQDNPTPAKKEKHQKFARLLDAKGFNFPTDLFSYFGTCQLILKLDEKRGMRAWEIPSVLNEGILFQMNATDTSNFEEVRLLRNEIGHGGRVHVTLAKSLRYASILHTLAAQIDDHIKEHFLVIQAV